MIGLLLRRRDLALVWTGGLVSMMGDWVLWVALPIRVYELTGSALATGGLIASLVVPEIVLGSFAGVFVDRWDRRRTMVIANLVQAAAIVPLFLVDSAGLVWVAYPVMAVSAALFTFAEPAENAFLPRLVPPEELTQANALNSLNNSLARLVGPALGGVLYLAGGLSLVTVVDACSFLAAAVLIAAVRTSGATEVHEPPHADDAVRGLVRLGREWRDGLRTIRRSRPVSVVLGVTALTAVGEGVFGVNVGEAVGPIAMLNVQGWGYIVSGIAVLALLGPSRTPRGGRLRPPRRTRRSGRPAYYSGGPSST